MEFLGIEIKGRLAVINQNSFVKPVFKVSPCPLINIVFFVICWTDFTELYPNNIVGRNFIKCFLFFRRNDIIGRANYLGNIIYFFKIIKKPVEFFYYCQV